MGIRGMRAALWGFREVRSVCLRCWSLFVSLSFYFCFSLLFGVLLFFEVRFFWVLVLAGPAHTLTRDSVSATASEVR